MSADSIRPTKLICLQGFYFETRPIFSSKETTINVLRALMGSREDMKDISVDDARNRAIEKLESLFSACLEKQVLFRAVRDSLVFWNTIAQDFEGCYALSPQDTRQVVVTYTEARHVYREKMAPTNLNNLVDQWIQVMDQTNSLPPPDSLNLAWRPGTSDVPVQTAQNIGPASGSSINATWPPAHFSEDEVMLITSTAEFRQELYAITSLNQGSPRAIPTDLTQPKEVRMFLCWAALVGTPSDSTKVLYPTPVAFKDRDMRRSWYRATGNQAMLYFDLDHFLDYAGDAFANRCKTSVTCLLTPCMMGIAPASALHDEMGDQLWHHPRMARWGSALTIRLAQQTDDGVQGTALEIIQFDPWPRCQEQLKAKFAGHRIQLTEFNKALTEKLEEWAGKLGGGIPIVGKWWGGNRVGGVEDDAVSMAAAFCLEFTRDRDLPADTQLLEGIGFFNSNEF